LVKRFLLFTATATFAASIPFAACGGDSTDGGADARVEHTRLDGAYRPDASCEVIIDTPPLQTGTHVPVNTPINYDSNPPSSGPHYAVWAAYTEYTQPVDLRYLVHDLEHGGVLLLYKCAGDCPDTVKALRSVRDAIPDDPMCTSRGEGVRVRVVIAPAAAWGWTYKAQCVDLPTLTAFAREHYGQGDEATCANGQGTF
jgi:hypothetical protein